MNIFVISKNPKENAMILDDLRLNKMILETAQLLSTTYRELWGEVEGLYKSTHKNHPCTIWTREKQINFKWLYSYFVELHNEFKFRKERADHASFRKLNHIFKQKADKIEGDISNVEFTFNCTEYKDLPVFESYKYQLIHKWKNDIKQPTWQNRGQPLWSILK